MKKFFVGVMALIMGVFFVGCGGSAEYTHVRVYIHENYYEKFEAMEFILEDFEWDNVKAFEYRYYSGRYSEDGEKINDKDAFLVLQLKKGSASHARDARQHLEKLDFVKSTSSHSSSANPGKIWIKEDK